MGVENITARILQEANDEAQNTKKAAEEAKAASLENAAREAALIKDEMAKKAQEDAKVLKERRNSVAELEARKMRLAMKQDMIEETFNDALTSMESMDQSEYAAFLLKELEAYKSEGGEIQLNAKDKAQIGSVLEEKLAGTALKVSGETAAIRGGFILKQGNVFVNASLEKMLETEKKQITAQVAGILFE